MAKRTQTYAVRLAVEDGGKTKAELVSVGQKGERSLKRIGGAGAKASRRLVTLGERVKRLRLGIGSLAGALAGAVAVGGFAAFVDRAISAADAIGKTADKIGVGVAALQELRFAARLAGIEERTLDMALQRFTRRVAEAAMGTGEAKEALASMGIALRDENGRIRETDELLSDVAEAFTRIEDPAERVRLAFKLFDSEGVAMVNVLSDGAEALEETRRRARDLGIVLDEDLVRNAEAARDQLDTLGKVISANLTRAVLDLAPVIADASEELAGLASRAGIAYEELRLLAQGDFEFEGLSLRATEATVRDLREEVKTLRAERDALGDGILDGLTRRWVEWRLAAKERALQQWQAKLAWMQAERERDRGPARAADLGSTPGAIEAGSAEEKRIAKAQAAVEKLLAATAKEIAAQARLRDAVLTGNPALIEQAEIANEIAAAFEELGISSGEAFERERRSVAAAVVSLARHEVAVKQATAAQEQATAAQEAATKAQKEHQRELERTAELRAGARRTLKELIANLEFETSLIGLNADERRRATVLRQAENIAKRAGLTLSKSDRDAILDELRAQERLNEELRKAESLRSRREGAIGGGGRGGGSKIIGGVRVAPGFQFGGRFVVPGAGPPDSTLVRFLATPGEEVTVRPPGVRQPSFARRSGLREGGGAGPSGSPVSFRVNIDAPGADAGVEARIRRIVARLEVSLPAVIKAAEEEMSFRRGVVLDRL